MQTLVAAVSTARIPVYVLASTPEEENHFIVRFFNSPRIHIVHVFQSAAEAEKVLNYVHTAVVFVSYHFNGNNGYRTVRDLLGMKRELRVAGFSSHYHKRQVCRMADAGALSFFAVGDGHDECVMMTEDVAANRRHYNNCFTLAIANEIKNCVDRKDKWWLNEITDVELAIAYEIYNGSNDTEAAEHLNMKKDRYNYVQKMAKLRHHLGSRSDIIRLAQKERLMSG
jgi:DNA-binding NarL/FixJ family response regulator